jgi:hypothetical protein
MNYYAIKLRVFPATQDMVEWLATPPEQLRFPAGERSKTEYVRLIHDPERMRDGFSIKLLVETEDDNPHEWSWDEVFEVEADRVEFIRAEPISEPDGLLYYDEDEPDRGEEAPEEECCYHCGGYHNGKRWWRDEDGDAYCSSHCLMEVQGDDAVQVSPDGISFHRNDDPWRKAVVGDLIQLTGEGIIAPGWAGQVIRVTNRTDQKVNYNGKNQWVYNQENRFAIVTPSEEE